MNEEKPSVNEWAAKLVRDRVPEIAMRNGRTVETRMAVDKEVEIMLIRKLQEEVSEFVKSRDIEEIADIEEVLRCYIEYKGMTWDIIEALRKTKNEENGSFRRKIILSKVKQ